MTNQELEVPKNGQNIFYQLLGNTLGVSIVNFSVWFAITFFVYLQTLSVFATAIIAGIYLVATAASGFWFGSIVDHHKKKSAMMVSSVISLIVFIASFIIYQLVDPNIFKDISNPVLWLFVMLIMLGVVVGNIRNIAMPTVVTMLVKADKRDKANGLVGTASGVGFLATSFISGNLVGLSGMFHVLILAIVVTIIALVHLAFLKVPEKGVAHLQDQPKKVDIKGTIKIISGVPGLFALILFATFNNFLGGVFMALMDAYGLSLVPVQTWGLLWAFLSTGFIVGGLAIAKVGLGKNPLRSLLLANVVMWAVSCVFTIQPSIILLTAGMYIYMMLIPYAEAAEQTILQKVVPFERQGRVFGFAQSLEQAASPLTAFLIGPIAQFIFIPFMTDGKGAELIGSWYGTGQARGIALLFTVVGLIGLAATIVAMRSKYYKRLSRQYIDGPVKASNIPDAQELSKLA